MKSRRNHMVLGIFFLLSLCIAIGGCGVKPGEVSGPPSAEPLRFPRTYPDPATDRIMAPPAVRP